MEVILAGHNIDIDILNKLKNKGWDGKENLTPETISAAYARISRDPRAVSELRKIAREEVDKAKKSNENIVFKMGHHSVAEHAFLNFDILKISRLAIEYLEEARLCSYTEKSQRYITLEGDYVIPREFSEEDKKLFVATVEKQIKVYKELFPLLFEYQKSKNKNMLDKKSSLAIVEGWAKEDARYVLPLAIEGQLGFSANARNLEYIIRKLRHAPLEEVRELSEKLYNEAKKIVPSLIILSDPEEFKKQFGWEVSDGFLKGGKEKLRQLSLDVLNEFRDIKINNTQDDIQILYYPKDTDTLIITALLFSSLNKDYDYCYKLAEQLRKEKKQKQFIKDLLKGFTEYDAMPREFEFVNFVFEIKLSSSAFAQLKRHRMLSLIKQNYDTFLGYIIPPSIKEIDKEDEFKKIMEDTEKVFKKLKEKYFYAAEYILTNAHKRRVLINVNLRELYHISRLRMDKHAQWDIQNISRKMTEIVKRISPIAGALLGGKHEFNFIYNEFFK